MKDRSGSYWLYSLAGAATGVVLGVAILVGFSCAMARLASPETTATGDPEALMGPVYAGPYSPTTQTTIGTIQLNSGWLWGPVGLLVMVALRGNLAARSRRLGLDRVVDSIENCEPLAQEGWRNDLKAHIHRKGLIVIGPTVLDQVIDVPERVIAKAVRELKKGKT